MSGKIIKSYSVRYTIGGQLDIDLLLTDDSTETLGNLSLKEGKRLINVLRNEKPLSYDAVQGKLYSEKLEQIGEGEPYKLPKNFSLQKWLSYRKYIREFIVFEKPFGKLHKYDDWSNSEKKQLERYFIKIALGKSTGLSETPKLALVPKDGDIIYTRLDKKTAWNYYLAFVAQSLVVEYKKLVSWSLKNMNEDERSVLLDSRKFFVYEISTKTYWIKNPLGYSSPGCPFRIYRFLKAYNIIDETEEKTIVNLLEWSKCLMHSSYIPYAENAYKVWGYRGYPPVERIINGTEYVGSNGVNYGIKHVTPGCYGTVGFLKMCLRTLNIAVEPVIFGHTLAHFLPINKYISHGDDPYNGLVAYEKELSYEELLIDQTTFDNWFGPQLTDKERNNNIGRQTRELALKYLPVYLLHLYCEDKKNGKDHASGKVYNTFNYNYTVKELEDKDLWARMELKIINMGGCENIPYK